MKKRGLCFLLTLCIAICAFTAPPSVYAADDEPEYSYLVDGYISSLDFAETQVNVAIGFYACPIDCIAILDIYDYSFTGAKEKTFIKEIPANSNEVEFSLPFKADDSEHQIVLSLVNNAAERIPYCDPSYSYFTAERTPYTCGDFTYIRVPSFPTLKAEIIEYGGSDEDIIIPETLDDYEVDGIGSNAFYLNEGISSIALPQTVTYIDEFALAYTSITSLNLPVSVKKIADNALTGCSSLAEITVAEDNTAFCAVDNTLYSKDKTELVRYAPASNSTEFTVPDGVKKIRSFSFDRAKALETVSFSDTVEYIDSYAFNLSGITTVNISASVRTIAPLALCYLSLTDINVAEDNPVFYTSQDGVLFNKAESSLVQYPVGQADSTSYTVPDGTKLVYQGAFMSSCLEAIVLPDSIESLGSYSDYDFCSDPLEYVLFKGTEDQWESICQNSDFLGDELWQTAELICNFRDGTKVFGEFSDCYYDNGQVAARIIYTALDDATAVLAVYNADGALISAASAPIKKTSQFAVLYASVPAYSASLTARVFFLNSINDITPVGESITAAVDENALESPHPFTDRGTYRRIYTYNGECESIDITFSDDTSVGECGTIEIYGRYRKLVGTYSGTELAGKTVSIPGNVIDIRLQKDLELDSVYGYKVTSIKINN